MSPTRCEPLCLVDVRDLIKWIADINRAYWPDWSKGSNRPAVIADSAWEGMAEAVEPVVRQVMDTFPGLKAGYPMITTVHPGDYVPPHTDTANSGWVTRVHIPIITNKGAVMIFDGVDQHLPVGKAYSFDITRPHAIRNDGDESRIHLMFDVMK